jgi:archaellum component FlaG (FlaF/FlaG flagellin family)
MTLVKRLPLFFIVILASCQNEGRWYPQAHVEVASHYEYADAQTGGKACRITLVIHNTGDTSIASGAVTLKVITNKHEYLQTTAFTSKIIPDGKIAVPIAVAYFEADEQVSSGGVSVYNAFFE